MWRVRIVLMRTLFFPKHLYFEMEMRDETKKAKYREFSYKNYDFYHNYDGSDFCISVLEHDKNPATGI